MPSDVDEHGIPRRGSALQIAYYVTCDQDALSAALTASGGEGRLDWRSPVPAQSFVEYKDIDFLRAVGRAELVDELAKWWPTSGPRWDALGIATADGTVVLLEAKANIPEIANGPACGSGTSGSQQGLTNREQIANALAATRAYFGVSHDAAAVWMESHCYQYANRLAHLCFFERLGVPALLAHVYFTDDSTHIATTASEFDAQRARDRHAMGLTDVTIASAVAVYLPAVPDAYDRLRSHLT